MQKQIEKEHMLASLHFAAVSDVQFGPLLNGTAYSQQGNFMMFLLGVSMA